MIAKKKKLNVNKKNLFSVDIFLPAPFNNGILNKIGKSISRMISRAKASNMPLKTRLPLIKFIITNGGNKKKIKIIFAVSYFVSTG